MSDRGPDSVWSAICASLEEQGFEATNLRSKTGEFWRHKHSGRHLQVPLALSGFLPDWLVWKFWAKVAEISEGAAGA